MYDLEPGPNTDVWITGVVPHLRYSQPESVFIPIIDPFLLYGDSLKNTEFLYLSTTDWNLFGPLSEEKVEAVVHHEHLSGIPVSSTDWANNGYTLSLNDLTMVSGTYIIIASNYYGYNILDLDSTILNRYLLFTINTNYSANGTTFGIYNMLKSISGLNYDFLIDWGDGSEIEVGSIHDQDQWDHEYAEHGIYQIRINNIFEGFQLKYNDYNKCLISFDNYGHTNIRTLKSAFSNYANMATCEFGDNDINVSDVTTLSFTWYRCSNLVTAPYINNLISVNDLQYAWYGCSNLITAPDISNLTSIRYLLRVWEECISMETATAVNNLTLVTGLNRVWMNCRKLVNLPAVNNLTLVTSITHTWDGCSNMVTAPDINTLIKLEELTHAWANCTSLVNASSVSNLILVTNLGNAWYNCTSMVNAPSVSNLNLVTSLIYTWYGCSSMVNAPSVSNLTLVNSLYRTWYGCTSMVNAPSVSNLTLVTSLTFTWYNCNKMVTAPSVNNLNLVTSLSRTWSGCSSLVNPSSVSNLTLVTYLREAWAGCTSMVIAPEISNLTLINNLQYTWQDCELLEDPPYINNLTSITTLQGAWRGCGHVLHAPDISNLSNVTDLSYAYSKCGSLSVCNIPDDITKLQYADGMLEDSTALVSTLDDIIETAYWSCLNNNNQPQYITMHFGSNNYSLSNQWKVDHLVDNCHWTIISNGAI